MKHINILLIIISLCIYRQLSFAQGWSHVNPIPTAMDIKAISFPSIDTGYISDGIYVFKTTDAGENWQKLDIYFTTFATTLYDLEFIDTNKGFILSYNRIYTTSDGGRTWSYQMLDPYYNKLYFRTDLVGYIYGVSDRMLKTEDGGVSWSPVIGNSDDFTISDLEFVNDSIGYAVTLYSYTRSLRKTTDGGLHWSEPITGFNFSLTSISILSEEEIFVGGYIQAYGPPYNVYIYHSTDGGNSWMQLNMGTVSNAPFSAFDIHFFNELEGYVGNKVHLYTTTDGGINWQYFNMLSLFPEGCNVTNMSWPDIEHGFVAGNDGLLAHTTDTGGSYVSMSDGFTTDIKSVFFSDTLHGFIAGIDNTDPVIKQTFDGGFTWTPCFMDTASVMTGIYFTDALNGLATAGERLFATSDGGYTWSTRYINMQDEYFKFLSFPHPNYLYAISEDHVSFSSDSGYSWSDITPGEDFVGSYIDFPDSLTGYIADVDNALLKTTNGGLTWQPVFSLEYGEEIYCIDFYNAEHGALAARSGTRITHDGGLTWSSTPAWYVFPDYVKMIDTNVVFLVGEQGNTGITRNGGDTFTFQPYSSYYGNSFSMQFLDEFHGYVVDDNGFFEIFNAFTNIVSTPQINVSTKPFFYPNPVVNTIIFTEEAITRSGRNTRISIYSIDSQLQITTDLGTKSELDVSSLSRGTYIIILSNDKEYKVQKFVKI